MRGAGLDGSRGAGDGGGTMEIAMQLPDLWQAQAVRLLNGGADVVVDAPTGAGKTWVFELFVKGRKGKGGQAVFTVPTRALANDKWREWRRLGWDVGIATGDLAENTGAPVLVATLETQRDRILSGDGPALLAVDEYQMIGDKVRGLSYELAAALAPEGTQLLMMSGSVENASEVVEWLGRLGRDAHLVRAGERPVPLDEMPFEQLPRLPEKVGAFWPRVVAGACLADLAPVLLFAPRREAAENLARKIAAALPDDDPIELPPELAARAGKGLVRMLRSRVAFHHSGLDYATRAAVVEPLAKAGQLRAIAATTGLAAGINFSVRSVAVTETSYREGAFLRELRADELLQMFGRAGRRGLDEVGFVITARGTPRLFDAAPLRLHRVNQIDWPTLLRVMGRSARDGGDPLAAAAHACGRLFSRQRLYLGVEEGAPRGEASGAGVLDGPRREEFRDRDGVWRPVEGAEVRRPLGRCWVRGEGGGWVPALESAEFVRGLGRGRLCRLDGRLGLEAKVGRVGKPDADGGRKVKPLGWVRGALGELELGAMARDEFESLVLPELSGRFELGQPVGLVRRGSLLAAKLDLAGEEREGLEGADGSALIDPERRVVAVDVETAFVAAGRRVEPAPGSAAHAWRKLGLIDDRGAPTRRGGIASLFQGGEGLVVAAALEDGSYPADELAWHLANLRAGHRFRETEGGGSARLAAVAHAAYGLVDHEGYLELGLPAGYGEGAAEVLADALQQGRAAPEGLAAGDLERAKLEWLSLLRHVSGARGPDCPRWAALSDVCNELLEKFAADPGDLPGEIDAARHGRRPRGLRRGDFPR